MAATNRQIADPEFVTQSEFAARVRTTPRTLHRWAREGFGPVPIKVRGRVLYRSAELQTWLDQRRDGCAGREG